MGVSSNKIVKARIIFNTDKTGWNSLWDMNENLNAWLKEFDFKSEMYIGGENTEDPEIILSIQLKTELDRPQPTDKEAEKKFMDDLLDDKKREAMHKASDNPQPKRLAIMDLLTQTRKAR